MLIVFGGISKKVNLKMVVSQRRCMTVGITSLMAFLFTPQIEFVCLFELILYVPVNSYGHVGMLPPFYRTFTQH